MVSFRATICIALDLTQDVSSRARIVIVDHHARELDTHFEPFLATQLGCLVIKNACQYEPCPAFPAKLPQVEGNRAEFAQVGPLRKRCSARFQLCDPAVDLSLPCFEGR